MCMTGLFVATASEEDCDSRALWRRQQGFSDKEPCGLQAGTSAFSASTVRPLSLTSAKPPSTAIRSGVSAKPLR